MLQHLVLCTAYQTSTPQLCTATSSRITWYTNIAALLRVILLSLAMQAVLQHITAQYATIRML
jgi:hypothetical protein